MLEFEDNFFSAEEIEGFYVSESMKRYWASTMETLRVLDEICKKHQITWYMDGGTLLGAVRHKGWIPWDDDIDICMKRNDYDKFLQVSMEEYPDYYYLSTCYSQDEHDSLWAGFCNSKRIIGTTNWCETHYGCPFIATVDIFPMDVLPRDEKEANSLLSIIRLIWSIRDSIQRGDDFKEWEEGLRVIESLFNISFERTKPLVGQLWRVVDMLGKSYTEKDGDYYVMWGGYPHYPNQVFRKEWYAEIEYLNFEQMVLPAPKCYREILTTYYGDYTVPVKDAADHVYPCFLSQIDKLKQVIALANER